MQEKLFKIFLIISVLIVVISVFPNKVFSDWVGDAKSFIDAADDKTSVDSKKLKSASDDIYNLLTSVGMVIAVVVGIILGITYMLAAAEEKAQVKESLVPYVVGCIVVFGAFGIWKLIINTFNGI